MAANTPPAAVVASTFMPGSRLDAGTGRQSTPDEAVDYSVLTEEE